MNPQEHRKNPIQDNPVAVGVHRDDTMGRSSIRGGWLSMAPISPICELFYQSLPIEAKLG